MVWMERDSSAFFSPWRALWGWPETGRLFDGLSSPRPAAPFNAYLDDEHLLLRAEVPGLAAEELDVQVEADQLIVSGRPRSAIGVRPFERRFRLPFRAEADAVSAKLTDGILELSLPRAEADRPRKIEIAQG